MCDAQAAVQRVFVELFFQLCHFAHGSAQTNHLVVGNDSHTCRVVTTILEATQALYEGRNNVSFSDSANDSAHDLTIL
jgi:hypothetical protein